MASACMSASNTASTTTATTIYIWWNQHILINHMSVSILNELFKLNF